MLTETVATPEYEAIKIKQNAAWASGDYSRIGVILQIVGENLAETMNLRPGMRVLDVAAGNGNATLAFARRWCDVVSTDYVESLLIQGRRRAEAEGLEVVFRTADAEKLPFGDAEFDAVVSTFGVMFTPYQERAACELLRVCRSGGRIGMANWTEEGFIGQLFKVLGRRVAPPAGVKSPALWGNRKWLESAFGDQAPRLSYGIRSFMFRYRSPAQFIEFFRTYYGPVHKAFQALDETGQAALEQDLLDTIARFNTARDGSMRVPGEYAEVLAHKI